MPVLDIPNDYLKAAAPVIVTSPTARCGTTLVQRLLSVSSNAFVYGEEVGAQLRSLTQMFAAQIGEAERHGAAHDADFEDALAGRLDAWRPGLRPPTAVMMKAWTEIYYALPLTLAEHGRSLGRPIWGFKWPGCPSESLKAFVSLMPQTRVVYVVRHLMDALKSAKARKFVAGPEDAARFAAQWAHNLQTVEAFAEDSRFLFLRYEGLVAEPEAHIARLEAFTGAERIDRAHLGVKVNTFEGDEANGHAPNQYIAPAALTNEGAPAALTNEEHHAALAHAGPALERFYPEAAESDADLRQA